MHECYRRSFMAIDSDWHPTTKRSYGKGHGAFSAKPIVAQVEIMRRA
jgi:hypothetical protein